MINEKCDFAYHEFTNQTKNVTQKKEKCLSEYVQISIRDLSKQSLTLSFPTVQWSIHEEEWSSGLVPWLPTEQLRTSPPGKMLQQQRFQDKLSSHRQTLGLLTELQKHRMVWAATSMAASEKLSLLPVS